ncbi:MAG: ABC transporter ATP-binding protein [Actinomycetaceae bacterium]|nr:ABC transporter ATP-binding protein [Actinomycetaceae bacterium]
MDTTNDNNKTEKEKKSSTGFLYSFTKKHARVFIASIIFAVCAIAAEITPYYFLGKIIESLLNDERQWNVYLTYGIYIGIAWIVRYIFHAVSTSLSHVATFKVLADMRLAITKKLSNMPLGVILGRTSGEYKNIIIERIDAIEPTLAHVVPELGSRLLAPIVVFVYMLFIDWRVALLSLLTIPIGMIFFIKITSNNEEIQQNAINKTKHLNSVAVEYIGGMDVIKIFGKAQNSYEKFVKAARDAAQVYVDWMRSYNTYFSAAMSIMPSVLFSVLPVVSLFMAYGSLSARDAILLIVMSMATVSPLMEAAGRFDDVTKMGVIVGEVSDLFDMPELRRPVAGSDADKTKKINGSDIVLDNVSFAYDENGDRVLHDVSMCFSSGSVNALVGPSGSGKSTIAKLIASFWDVDSGRITFGGVDIKNIPLEVYMSNIAYVSQDNYLFNESVLDNIKMGNPDASDEEAIDAAKIIGCHDFIMGLDEGYNTKVGSAGGKLSGGQAQRICIARAMLKRAPVIILDEATAYADPENESLVQDAIARLAQGKTLIVIAHRLSTIEKADVIHVVHEGKIVASGNHEHVLKESSVYKNMWDAHVEATGRGVN